ncbi:MAG: hypothetical protein EA398_03065 [Deltaproteobacteria bacterium]|nr:MAG: hypothetical protein EA398_03065 [Deltaproteobacteria bacterium]
MLNSIMCSCAVFMGVAAPLKSPVCRLLRADLAHGWLVFAAFACVAAFSIACGGKDTRDGEEVSPSQVRHADLARGFWIADPDSPSPISVDQQILQFTTVNEARALYGDLGVIHGTGGTLLQTLDQSLEWFSGDDRILLTFSRTVSGRISIVAGTRVSGGSVGLSRLGFVGFDYGFAPPEERPIRRFVRGEELVLGHELDDDLAFRYRWAPDCHWTTDSGWTTAGAVLDAPHNPWFSVGLTRTGELVGAFHPTRDDGLQMLVWAEGACPVYGLSSSLPMRAGAQLIPDAEDGLVGVRRTASGLGTVHVRPGQALVESEEGPAEEQTPVEQLRRLPDGRVVFLETDLRLDRSQSSAARWVARPGEMAAPWPLPPLPSFDDNLHVRLRADGTGAIVWFERVGAERVRRVQVERPGGAWQDISLQGTTADGATLDLSDPALDVWGLEVDVDGRVVAMVPAEVLIPAVHFARPLPSGAKALVRLDGEAVEATFLPTASLGRLYQTHMAADGTWRGFGEFGPSDQPGTTLEVVTWPVGEEVQVLQPGIVTRGNQRGLHGFWDFAWYLGTYIWHRRHVHVEEDGAILISNGWSQAIVRPSDALHRPRERTVTLALEDAPPGARVETVHAPRVVCEETCDVTAAQGTVLGLRVVSPPGWVVEGSRSCRESYVDAEVCHVVVEPGWTCLEGHEGEPDAAVCEARSTHVFRWRRTPAVELTDAAVPGWWGAATADADGEVLAILNMTEGVLSDGTEVSGGDNSDPVPVLTRWSGTALRWAAPLPRYALVDGLGFARNGDALLVLQAPDRRTLSFPEVEGGEEVPMPGGTRAVVRLAADDGRLLGAPRFEVPRYVTARAHAVTPDGVPLTFGRAGRPSGAGGDPGDVEVPLEHELLLRHADDGGVEVLHERPETRGGGEAMFAVHPSGGLLFVRMLDGVVHWEAFDADLRSQGSEGQTLDIEGRLFRDLKVVPAGEGYLLGVVGGSVSPSDGRPVVDGSSALLVLELDATGGLERAVALPNAGEPMGAGTLMGLTRLPDGRVAGSVRRGTAGGVEALLLEGEEALNLGSLSTQVTQQEGFLSVGLFARPDGTLVWVARPWQQVMVLRPFLLRSPFLVRLDPAQWAEMGPMMPSQFAYVPR